MANRVYDQGIGARPGRSAAATSRTGTPPGRPAISGGAAKVTTKLNPAPRAKVSATPIQAPKMVATPGPIQRPSLAGKGAPNVTRVFPASTNIGAHINDSLAPRRLGGR